MAQLITTFTGTATFRIADPQFTGPFFEALTLSLVFSADRKSVDMGVFPTIRKGPIPQAANDTITITKKAGGSGSFDMGSGAMQMPLTLHFDHSLPDIFFGDSDLPLVLTTGSTTSPTGAFTLAGTPLNPTTGIVTLVGASRFERGGLAPRDCSISITGTIVPSPFVTSPFVPVYAMGSPGTGIGGYDLGDPADRAFALDYNSNGKLDHLVLYRPGTGTMWIMRNSGGVFAPVYAMGSPGTGIGGYDLGDPADRAFAFDYNSSGKLDHLVLYRPGTGTLWIMRNNSGVFTPVYAMGSPGTGIGGYDLGDPADRAFAFDYNSSGKLDHLVLYRPNKGTMWILRNSGGTFAPIFDEGSPGVGIGGYDLGDPADRALAFDYNSSGKLDHLVLYRPGMGTIWILMNLI